MVEYFYLFETQVTQFMNENKKNVKFGYTTSDPKEYVTRTYRNYNKPGFIYCFLPVHSGRVEEDKFREFLQDYYTDDVEFLRTKKNEFFNIMASDNDMKVLTEQYIQFSQKYDNNLDC